MKDELSKTRSLVLGSAVAVSVLMAVAGLTLLLAGPQGSGLPFLVEILLVIAAPAPAAGTIFLIRAADRCAADAETRATRDPLTGLYNQQTFWDLLQYETQRAARQQYKFSLLLVDLDNFKVINDKYGHEVGDRFLREFAAIMKTSVRKGDILARYEGDNFTAILPVCDEEQAFVVAHRIMDGIREHAVSLPDDLRVRETVSIGVSVFPHHAEQPHDLYLLAESMLRQAKSSGKDHLAFPGERDNIALLRNLGEMNILILEALNNRENKRLVPYFQPIVDVKDRSVLAYEVLTRIIVDGRVIPASNFIAAAENMGAIGKIDYQLIEQTFRIVKERNYTGSLFLNLSPKALVISDFLPTVRALFREYRIDPQAMVFEITERDTVRNVELVEGFLRKLKDEGFRFAIDDFGSGYSSFQYLKTFPVDFLKVDGDFIRTMGRGGAVEKEIVTSIADLGSRLRIKTIAEFVEDEAILREVDSAGIHYAQGYYIKRPSPDLG